MMPPGSDTYKQIEQLVLQKYFPSFYYDYNQLQQKTVSQEEQLRKMDTTLNEVTSENEELKKQIAALQKQLKKNNDLLTDCIKGNIFPALNNQFIMGNARDTADNAFSP